MSCGIDFGTSNSALAIATAAGVRLLPLEGDHGTLPTVMFFESGQATPVFGRRAIDRYLEGHPGRFMRALKSILGSALMEEKTVINNTPRPFIDVISLFLANMRAGYERSEGHAPEQVVVGRPVYFVDDNPAADRAAEDQLERAAKAAGFRHVSFQYEPIAAALDYEQQVRGEELVLVVDIGAGTSDFSVVRVSRARTGKPDRKQDILGNGGVHIGGNDFDRALSLHSVMPEFGYKTPTVQKGRLQPNSYFLDLATWHKIHFLYTARTRRDVVAMQKDSVQPQRLGRFLALLEHMSGHDVAYQVEAAKIALSQTDHAVVALDNVEAGLRIEIKRPHFEATAADNLDAVLNSLRATLHRAGVAPAAIATLVMTGGAAQMPLLRHALRSALPEAALHEADAFSSVASGLALEAGRQYGVKSGQ
jgi:hypothetical chaperone protein